MSKVSLKNESLPSFEPIEQKNTTQQKRKRVFTATLKEANGGVTQPAAKKSRAKKNTSAATIAPDNTNNKKTAVWIGATLQQKGEQESSYAAYSVYYGVNDDRNHTEKIIIEQDQTLDHVYTMGVIRALEKAKDDSSALLFYTGSKLLQNVMEQDEKNELCDQIKEIIQKRNGSTSIHYISKQDESQLVTHKLAIEKLLEENSEEDKMIIDDEATLVNSLEVAHTPSAATTTTTIAVEETIKVEEKVVVTTMEKEIEEKTVAAEPLPSPSWAKTLSLSNLLDILKAPFYRKQK